MTPPQTPRPRPAGSPFRDPVPPVIPTFEVGDRVTHDKQGMGRVVEVQADAVVVDFNDRPAAGPLAVHQAQQALTFARGAGNP